MCSKLFYTLFSANALASDMNEAWLATTTNSLYTEQIVTRQLNVLVKDE